MATERAEFSATLDTKQVDAALEKTRAGAMSLGGGLSKIEGGLDKLGGKAGADAKKAIESLGFALGGVAQQAGTAVNIIGDLAGAASGGGLAVVTTMFGLATAGALAFYESMKKDDEAAARLFRTLREASDNELQRVLKDIKAIKAEIDNFGKSSNEVRRNTIEGDRNKTAADIVESQRAILFLQDRGAQIRQAMAANEKQLNTEQTVAYARARAELKDNERRLMMEEERLRSARELLPAKDQELALARQALQNEEARKASAAALVDLKKAEGEIDKQNKQKNTAFTAAEGYGYDLSGYDPALDRNATELAASRTAQEAMSQAQRDLRQANLKDALSADALRVKSAKDAAEAIAKFDYEELERKGKLLDEARTAYQGVYVDALGGALGNATGALNTFFVGMATGQKHAAEEATAAFLTGTGNQLVGIGTKAILEGAIISANPLTPGAGIGMIGLGAAAIGVGIGMGAGGAAISAAIPRDGGTEKARRDRGIDAPRSGSASGSGAPSGGLTVNHYYAVGGPLAEDSARATVDLFKVAQRRRLNG